MNEEPKPLLSSFARNPGIDSDLRRSLGVLKDRANPELKKRIEAVLDGKSSLRDLAVEPSFVSLITPLAEKGWRNFESLSKAERGALDEDARRRYEGDG